MNNSTTPKIAIIGYGSMGKEIERTAIAEGLTISNIFDIDSPLLPNANYDFDVAIDFSNPDAVESNVKILSAMGKSIVLGTTGWNDKLSLIESIVDEAKVGLVYDSNFSIGMTIFRKVVQLSAQLLNSFPNYDIMLNEVHHKRKKDHPSGTAISIAEIILENLERKTEIATEHINGEAIRPEQLDVSCSRVGEVAGTHTIYIDSLADSIQLSHIAKNRSGFAAGAVFAAKWIYNKSGIYMFRDLC